MIGVSIALMVIGIAFGFAIPWLGILLGLIGLILFVTLVVGFGRRSAREGSR